MNFLYISFVFILHILIILLCIEGIENIKFNSRMKRYISPVKAQISKMKTCDQSTIPVMDNFEISKFAGEWYELGKTVSNYIDVNDGMWKITKQQENNDYKFLYSGRNSEDCIKPISGVITTSDEIPSTLILNYKTFTTKVIEKIRILYTDYNSIAVIYACLHVNEHTGGCHPAGILGSLWTREPHVKSEVYSRALKYLETACIDSLTIKLRNIIGVCQTDNLDIEDENDMVHDICYQTLNTGSCLANLQRFYYDKNFKQCKEFSFQGCNGNKNNFLTLQECEHQCLNNRENKFLKCSEISPCALHCPPCCQQKNNGCVSCDCQSIIIDESFQCLESRDCPPNCPAKEIYANCYKCMCSTNDSKSNNDPSNCLEPKEIGTCENKTERYYYNSVTRNCEQFTFSGCGGNKNNFISIISCLKTCHGKGKSETDLQGTNIKAVKQGDDAAVQMHIQLATLLLLTTTSILYSQII